MVLKQPRMMIMDSCSKRRNIVNGREFEAQGPHLVSQSHNNLALRLTDYTSVIVFSVSFSSSLSAASRFCATCSSASNICESVSDSSPGGAGGTGRPVDFAFVLNAPTSAVQPCAARQSADGHRAHTQSCPRASLARQERSSHSPRSKAGRSQYRSQHSDSPHLSHNYSRGHQANSGSAAKKW